MIRLAAMPVNLVLPENEPGAYLILGSERGALTFVAMDEEAQLDTDTLAIAARSRRT